MKGHNQICLTIQPIRTSLHLLLLKSSMYIVSNILEKTYYLSLSLCFYPSYTHSLLFPRSKTAPFSHSVFLTQKLQHSDSYERITQDAEGDVDIREAVGG